MLERSGQKRTSAVPEEEEDRTPRAFAQMAHPQRDVEAIVYSLGDDCTLELRRQESIWWLNLGRVEVAPDGSIKGIRPFWLCPVCGESVEQPVNAQRAKRKKTQKQQWRHSQTCTGEPQEVALGHQTRADTLRLIVPGIETMGKEGVRWAWSLVHAIIQGATMAFQLDEGDIDGFVLEKRDGNDSAQVMEIFWVDTVVGGSGVLKDLVENFPKVAQFALKHLEGHDCASSCYRCLRTYRNQRVHELLDWRLVVPWLEVAAKAKVEREELFSHPLKVLSGKKRGKKVVVRLLS